MSVELTIDAASFENFRKQIEAVKVQSEKGAFHAIAKVALRLKTTAQLRLKGRSHVKTSRLINSIYVQGQGAQQSQIDELSKGQNTKSYSSQEGSFDSTMDSVRLGKDELAIGTNVEYAETIERGARAHAIAAKNGKALKFNSGGETIFRRSVNHPGFKGDSYLYWALQNIDMASSVAKEMRDTLKFGEGVKAQTTKK